MAQEEDNNNNNNNSQTPESTLSHASNTPTSTPESGNNPSPPSASAAGTSNAVSGSDNRAELVERARMFLFSPQIRYEDPAAKRRFLAEKGLTDAEISGLLQQLPTEAPLIPPRTYPQPPPSNLPNLLVGLARIFTWIAGGSVITLLVYYRYLLPLLSRSYQARVSIKAHQKDLLSRLTTSIQNLKEVQSETFALLPKPQLFREDPKYKDFHTLEQVLGAGDDKLELQGIPTFSILRCALEEFSAQGKEASTEELFAVLQAKLPWLQSEDDSKYQDELWKTLSTNPSFAYTDTETTSIWRYDPPSPPSPPPLLSSLTTLRSTMPAPKPEKESTIQHALQTISEFTGYLTTQIYAMPTHRTPGFGPPQTLKPEEEELRKEIRALKGLVLNRRSFMGVVPSRANSTPLLRAGTSS